MRMRWKALLSAPWTPKSAVRVDLLRLKPSPSAWRGATRPGSLGDTAGWWLVGAIELAAYLAILWMCGCFRGMGLGG